MKVEFLGEVEARFCAHAKHGKHWTLINPLAVRVDAVDVVVPAGFWTDFASVPRFIWPIIDPYSLGNAPVLHDFMYFTRFRDQKYCDDAFLAGMETDQIALWKRCAAYNAVRLFGGVVYKRYGQENDKYSLAWIDRKIQVADWHPDWKEVESA